jgi:hypothetical protein
MKVFEVNVWVIAFGQMSHYQCQYFSQQAKKSKDSLEVVLLTLSEAYVHTSLGFHVIGLCKPSHHIKVTDQNENGSCKYLL